MLTCMLLAGAPSLGLVAGMPFPHLTHLPAYPWLGRPAFPPALFSSLGALPSPLLAHGLPHASAAAEFGKLSSYEAGILCIACPHEAAG